ncbi:MAG: HAD hydrolase-like protein, partial [Clostridia bacterium]|nr:HAD hydrolase-like protein [Clostridia bacterium]
TDPGEGITNSVAYALEKLGITPPERKELYKFIGPPLYESFMEYYGLTPENAQKGVKYYREYFDARGIFQNVPYPDAAAALNKLKELGYVLVLATSKPEPAALRILKKFETEKYFDFVCGADLEGKLTKKDDVIRYAMRAANIADPSSAVMVGDRKHDVYGARANGMICVGVTFGYGGETELKEAKAAFIAQNFAQVTDYIINLG